MPAAQFTALNDDLLSFQSYNGRYLLVNFWATWCAPCVVELPSLEKLQTYLTDRPIDVIAVSLDHNRPLNDIHMFLQNRLIGDFAAYKDFGRTVESGIPMRGIPTTYLLHPEGYILKIFEGSADWNSPPARRFFDELLPPVNAS
jgi:thiol-disulfide isomerase/thioredoxin